MPTYEFESWDEYADDGHSISFEDPILDLDPWQNKDMLLQTSVDLNHSGAVDFDPWIDWRLNDVNIGGIQQV